MSDVQDGVGEPSTGAALDPLERSSEIIFGLIMALTFTCTLSVATSSRNDVALMLAAALACNVAWGLVDAAMYILGALVTRQRNRSIAEAIRGADPRTARRLILENVPDGVGKTLDAADLDRIASGVRSQPLVSLTLAPTQEEIGNAIKIFLLVFLSTLPVALPFMLITNVTLALRISNAIAVLLLYILGVGLGRYMSWPRPWAIGIAVAFLGAVLVAITIALGG